MMKKHAIALLVLVAASFASCATTVPSSTRVAPIADILGVRLGMSRDAVRSGLAPVARLEREERRRHEVWTLNDDPRFASLIIGYTTDWNVRFVTAVAKPDGVPVRYDEVLDLASAKLRTAGQTHTYTWVTGTPPYSIIAIGGPQRVDYLSIEDDHD